MKHLRRKGPKEARSHDAHLSKAAARWCEHTFSATSSGCSVQFTGTKVTVQILKMCAVPVLDRSTPGSQSD